MSTAVQILQYAKSSYLRIPGPSSRPVIVFIPGNPGIAQYYRDYIKHLHALCGLECVVLSHLGSDLAFDSKRVYTLDEQIAHKIGFLNSKYASRTVYLFGHSIGAWMVQRVAVAQLQCTIKFCGLVTPTLYDIALSSKGKKLTLFKRLFGRLGVSLLVGLLSLLSWAPWLVRLVLGHVQRHLSSSVHTTTLALAKRPQILRQILEMGFEEMARVGPQDVPEFWTGDYKVWLLYALHDHWVLDSTRAATIERAQVAPVPVQVQIEKLSHAFVMTEAEQVAEFTAKALPQEAAESTPTKNKA